MKRLRWERFYEQFLFANEIHLGQTGSYNANDHYA